MGVQRKLRNLVEGPAGRWLMLGLLIFFLVIFTVTDEMTDAIRGLFSDAQAAAKPTDVAGSYSVLPGARRDVTFRQFDEARTRYGLAVAFLAGAPPDRAHDLEVWIYMVLLDAARREGIQVSYEEVAEIIQARLRKPFIWDDPAQYKAWVRENFRVGVATFEECLRDFLTAFRVREVYRAGFEVAPPLTREEVVKQYASQNIEYARGNVAVLDAGPFLAAAAEELAAEGDPRAKLKEFYDTDPAVKLDPLRFRNPRRYRLEFLYTIHHKVDTEEALQKIVDLFSRAWPQLDVRKLEANVKEQRDYFGIYRDRLLEQAGSSWSRVRKEVDELERKAAEAGGEPKEPGETGPDAGGEDEPEDAEPKDGEPKDAEPKVDESTLAPHIRKRMFDHGFQIVKDQVDRELRIRGMYQWFWDQARDNESLKVLFEKLEAKDDPADPICSTEPGQGLIVYRDFGGQPLTGEELEAVEDSGVKFTHNMRPRVTQLGESDLPKKSTKADVLGPAGHGRQIFRLLEVIREQPKTFDELTEGEQKELRDKFYLPARARERAKEKLEDLRKRLAAGDVAAAAFREEAEKLGCRFHADEWIVATYDFLAEPDRSLYWDDEYRHMRDRYFLRKHLAGALARDRAEKELKAGTFLEVAVDSGQDAEDPGAAYLYQLVERRKPDADTVPPGELATFMNFARNRKRSEDQDRWTVHVDQLIGDFDMVFYDDMRRRVDEELKRRAEARQRGRQ